jgi:translation elongation factor EF-4
VLKLCNDKRGIQNRWMSSRAGAIPLFMTAASELVMDFFDHSKAAPAVTLRWITNCRVPRSKLVKVDILINGDIVDA